MNFDKEGSKFEKKMFVCVCVEGRGARCTDTKSVCKIIFIFIFFLIFFFFFLIFVYPFFFLFNFFFFFLIFFKKYIFF